MLRISSLFRHVLCTGATALLIVSGVAHDHGGGGGPVIPPAPGKIGSSGTNLVPYNLLDFQPTRIYSSNGVLNADLDVRYGTQVVGGKSLYLRTFNGKFPGPTFVASPGDTMNIRMLNNLPANIHPPQHDQDHNTPHDFNTVNLHTHGLNVSPEGRSDNVLVQVPPDTYFPYEIIVPTNHPSGLFWYHPHKHGSTTVQVASGMAGNILLRGGLDEIPEIAAARDVELILQQITIMPDGQAPSETNSFLGNTLATKHITVNGLSIEEVTPTHAPIPPVLTMQPGEVQRWRLTHAGPEQFFRLQLEGHTLHVVSFDGITLPSIEEMTELYLAPGNRAEVLVKPNGPGTFAFRQLPYDHGFGAATATNTFFNVVVAGLPKNMDLPTELNPPTERLPDIQDEEIVRERTVAFSIGFNPDPLFLIDGKLFDPNRVDQTMLLNTAEEWTLTNDQFDEHPFHIHVNWFQVTHINGIALPRPRWQDTVIIPRNGTVTIRHRFENYPGKFVVHCHILAHEDTGMMSLVEVIDPENLTPQQAWRKQWFNNPADEGDGADFATPKNDGVPNLYKYAFGINPQVALPAGSLPNVSTAPATLGNALSLSYRRPKTVDTALQYRWQTSTDLTDWMNDELSGQVTLSPIAGDDTAELVTERDSVSFDVNGAPAQRYIRLNVSRPEPQSLSIMED